jgi:hypothetical protein
MRRVCWVMGIPMLLALGSRAMAQPPVPAPGATQPSLVQPAPNQPLEPLGQDAFAQAPTTGGEAPTGLNPRMIGDFPGSFVLRTITVPSIQTITTTSVTKTILDKSGGPVIITVVKPLATSQVPILVNTVTRVPVASSTIGFKVGENQSPTPEDRAFFTYNFFGNLHGPSGAFAGLSANSQQSVAATGPLSAIVTNVTTVIPGVAPVNVNLHGELLGFEKTIFDGRASVGVRVPLFQQLGDGSFNQDSFGDLGVMFNYAFYLDRITGNTLSAGLLVSTPTGAAVNTTIGDIHSTVLQPFLGFRWNRDRFYLLGFSSLAVPIDARDVTLLFTDVGVGYWAYRGNANRLISGVAPTVEAHVTTPFNHRSLSDAISAFDIVDFTGGVQIGLRNRSMLTLGVCTPITGPRPFNIEAIAQFNFRF